MKRFRPSVRRVLSITTAALAGAAATLAFAAPATAIRAAGDISIKMFQSNCLENGQWDVDWVVFNDLPFDVKLTVVSVLPPLSSLDFTDDTLLASAASLEVEQIAPVGATSASLTLAYVDAGNPSVSGEVNGTVDFESACEAVLTAEFTDNCDGTVTVKLFNGLGENVTFEVNGEPHVVDGGATKTINNVAPSPGVNVMVGDLPIGIHGWKQPEGCQTAPPTTTPPLANTGTPVGSVIGTGGALVGVGVAMVGLFLLLRRRRANTTA